MSSELLDRHHKKTAVLLIAPETGRLPNGMGPLARFEGLPIVKTKKRVVYGAWC
jgi:hypothetical protein